MPENIKLITPEQEAKLTTAMVDAIRDANSGVDKNAAIAKHANKHGLSPEFACRMVEAFNTSKTLRHLQDSTGEKRASTFDLASKDDVLKLMYMGEDGFNKEPTPKSDKLTIDFNELPEPNTTEAEPTEKAAGCGKGKPKPKPKMVMAEKKARIIRGAREKIADMRRELTMQRNTCKYKAAYAIDKLAEHLVRTDNVVDFDKLEAHLLHTYGDMAKTAMDLVWSRKDFEILGEVRAEKAASVNIRKSPALSSAMELMDALTKAAEAEAAILDFENKIRDIEQSFNGAPAARGNKHSAAQQKTVAEGDMEVDKPEAEPVPEEQLGNALYNSLTQTPAAVGIARNIANRLTGYKPTEPSLLDTSYKNLEHEGKLRRLRMTLLVNDMLANDPILRAYAPEDVVNAVNVVSETAPALSTNPLMLRNMTARVIQQGGHMDSSELEQLLKTESLQRELRAPNVNKLKFAYDMGKEKAAGIGNWLMGRATSGAGIGAMAGSLLGPPGMLVGSMVGSLYDAHKGGQPTQGMSGATGALAGAKGLSTVPQAAPAASFGSAPSAPKEKVATSWGNVISGAGTGAMTGSMLGPKGAILGAIAGGLYGMYSGGGGASGSMMGTDTNMQGMSGAVGSQIGGGGPSTVPSATPTTPIGAAPAAPPPSED